MCAAGGKPGRCLPAIVFALLCAVPLQQVEAASGDVYVSGQGIAVEQAVQQALMENPRESKEAFWIIVAGPAIAEVTKNGSGQGIREALRQVRERGGMVYACRADLARYGVREEDLLDGVIAVSGYGANDLAAAQAPATDGIALPESTRRSQLIFRTCADDDGPAS